MCVYQPGLVEGLGTLVMARMRRTELKDFLQLPKAQHPGLLELLLAVPVRRGPQRMYIRCTMSTRFPAGFKKEKEEEEEKARGLGRLELKVQ